MISVDLNAETRVRLGKGPVGRLRKDELIPAVLYGDKVKENLNIRLKRNEVIKALHTDARENVLVNLSIDGKNTKQVIFKDFQYHPVKSSIEHIDFLAIDVKKKIIVFVPIHLEGKCPGVVAGGILQHEHRRLKIIVLPTEIPVKIDLDISSIEIGGSLHASDIVLPKGVELDEDEKTTILSVTESRVSLEVEEEVEGEAAEGEAAEGAEAAPEGEAKKEG